MRARTRKACLVLAMVYAHHSRHCPDAANGVQALEQKVNVAASGAGGRAWAARSQEADGLRIAGAIDGDMGSSSGWAFDGGLSNAFALFALGHRAGPQAEKAVPESDNHAQRKADVEAEVASRMPWVHEIGVSTAVGRHDHHITMLRLWYSDAFDASVLSNATLAHELLRTPTPASALFKPLPVESASASGRSEEVQGQVSVVGNRIVTGGGVGAEHIIVKFRSVQAAVILLKVDATDSTLCDRRVSSSENEYVWHDGLVGARHNTYQQHRFFLSLDDVCHNAILTEFQVWTSAEAEAAAAGGVADAPERGSAHAILLSAADVRAVLHQEARAHVPQSGIPAGAEGEPCRERKEGFSVPGGSTDHEHTADGRCGRPDACALLAGEGTILFVGDSRMRAFFWQVLARMSGRPVAAHINPSLWHIFGARAATAGERPGGRLGRDQNASDVGWCWQHPRGVSSQALAGCAGSHAVDLTRVLLEAGVGAGAMGDGAAAAGLASDAAAGRVRAGQPSPPGVRVRVCASNAAGKATEATAPTRAHTPSRDGAEQTGQNENEKTEATYLSFIHTPSLERLFALFRSWAAEAESGAGAGGEQASAEPSPRPLVVWSPPLEEISQVRAR